MVIAIIIAKLSDMYMNLRIKIFTNVSKHADLLSFCENSIFVEKRTPCLSNVPRPLVCLHRKIVPFGNLLPDLGQLIELA